MERGRIQYIADDPIQGPKLVAELERRGFSVALHHSGVAALEALADDDPETVVTDLDLPDIDGLQVCQRVPEIRPGIPVVVVCAAGPDRVVAALRAGAQDFLEPPLRGDVLALTLDRSVSHCRLRREIRLLRRRARVNRDAVLLGESAAMRALTRLINRVADTTASVLIVGESGTGKELVAQELHRRSRRAAGPFVAVNCAAVPEALLESELFGHARGAFTDAKGSRKGLFQRANGGTLFLDEIGDMPLALQPKLLRALQERTVRPVGSDDELPIDVRVVAATHRDVEAAVEQERFRQDLLYRLDVVRIDVPPLRDRGNDILTLAQRFLEQAATRFEREVTGFDVAAARKLLDHRWPGNVRELQNCVERAVVVAEHDHVVVDDLAPKVRGSPPRVAAAATQPTTVLRTLDEVEQAHIQAVLRHAKGNKTEAARILGIDRKTLHRKLS